MSTRSSIAILTADSKIKSIYCHSDGYPEGVGAMLTENYNTPELAQAIIDQNDCSALHETIETSRFYNTWRNENTQALKWKTIQEWRKYAGDTGLEYTYLFDSSKWICEEI